MHITELINPDRIRYSQKVSSKKRVLEQLSQLFAESTPNLTQDDIFDSLIERERLGSTGFGNGVAIPHSRVQGLKQPLAAFIKLDHGIDFDAMDNEPVDLLFALLVPEDSTEEHLQLLAQLAQMVSEPDLCSQLRTTDNQSGLYELLQHWEHENISA